MRKAIVALVLAALAAGAVVIAPRPAEAQMMTRSPVNASPQGAIGGGLLGAELVVFVQGLAGVRPRWAYAVFPLIGAAGGAVGGFFLDQAIDSGTDSNLSMASTGMLVVGLGLIIPAAIVYANATAYRPDDTATSTDDNAGSNQPLEESEEGTSASGGSGSSSGSGGSSAAPGGGGGGRRARPRFSAPSALLDYVPGRMRFGVPALSLVRSYSLEETRQYGLPALMEWRIPVLSARF